MDDQYSHERDGRLVGFLDGKEVYHGDKLYHKYKEELVPCIAYLSLNYTRPQNKTEITVRVIDWGEGLVNNCSTTNKHSPYSKEDCHSFEVSNLYRKAASPNVDPEYESLFI